jgi:AmiR/NasT family two-component response regulator
MIGQGETRNILVVEDEFIIACDIIQGLTRRGFSAHGPVATGEEAVSLSGRLKPDVVLMDIRLAGAMDGVDAAAVIERLYAIPVVYLTASSERATIERAMATHPLGLMLKPFDADRLAEMLAAAPRRKES